MHLSEPRHGHPRAANWDADAAHVSTYSVVKRRFDQSKARAAESMANIAARDNGGESKS